MSELIMSRFGDTDMDCTAISSQVFFAMITWLAKLLAVNHRDSKQKTFYTETYWYESKTFKN